MNLEYKHPGRRSKCPTESELAKLYIGMNMTSKEIAKVYGVSHRTVEGWILKFRNADKKAAAQLAQQNK